MIEEHFEFEGGKYTVVRKEGGSLRALRHGDPWRDLTGDKLVASMLYEIEDLRIKVAELEHAIDEVNGD